MAKKSNEKQDHALAHRTSESSEYHPLRNEEGQSIVKVACLSRHKKDWGLHVGGKKDRSEETTWKNRIQGKKRRSIAGLTLLRRTVKGRPAAFCWHGWGKKEAVS